MNTTHNTFNGLLPNNGGQRDHRPWHSNPYARAAGNGERSGYEYPLSAIEKALMGTLGRPFA
jgi:hypothetical protein